MDHTVAVCANESEISQLRSVVANHMERHDMVTLDVTTAAVAVRLFKIEAACLACEGLPAPSNCFNLSPTKPAGPFTGDMQAD